MDDIWVVVVLVLLVGGGGWVMGVAGFFRAGRALRELEALRAGVAAPSPAVVARGVSPLAAALEAGRPQVAEPPPMTPPPLPVVEPVSDLAEPPPLPPTPPTPPPRRSFDVEELLTARWGVWLGSAALLLAGVFLVRYAAEEGWLGPAVRCVAMAVLGFALIGGGDWLRRRPAAALPFPDQVPGGLAAGGVAILFGAAYAAGVMYGLVPPLFGFVLMAGASLVGLAAALRLGQLVAAVGIVGAFVTPLLVQTEAPSWPGLFAYLLFVAAASLAVVRYSAWVWLGWACTVAGAAWVVLASLAVPADAAWAPALFVPALAALHLVLLPGAALDHPVGARLAWVPVAAVGLAGLLLAVVQPGTATTAGGLLLAPVTMAKAAAEARLSRLPWVSVVLFLLLVAAWGLPAWDPTGEAVYADGNLLAVLPGDWTPSALRPFLLTLLGMCALYAAGGLVGERRLPRPLPWAALTAAVPVLTMALAYVRVRQFQPDASWSFAALALAAGLTGAAALAARSERDGVRRAGIHAAGAVAALSLGFAMLLSGQWLTIALVLVLPALVVIEERTDLPPLRRVALAVAAVALVRLLLNGAVLDYADGQAAVLNSRALAYAVAAASFFVSARLARRRADDRLVAVLECGCAAFVTALVVLEIRQGMTGGLPATANVSFIEAALQVSALCVLATASLWLDGRAGRATLGWVWRVQGALALAGGCALILLNPALLGGVSVGRVPILDALLPAYAVPAVLAVAATRSARVGPVLGRVLSVFALLAGFTWVTLEVRHLFHPGFIGLDDEPVLPGELWAWSGAWMALAVGLMAAGLRTGRRSMRLAALAVMALVTAKVFLVDMSGLTGLWRVLSFLGLGLTLIGLGSLYGRFVGRAPRVPEG